MEDHEYYKLKHVQLYSFVPALLRSAEKKATVNRRMQRSPVQEELEGETSPTPTEVPKTVRKFHNGWNKQLEALVAEWADKASCYQWMHQKTEVRFQKFNYYFTIPVIIMSTLTGTANFATNSIVSTEEQAKFVTFGIGAISLIAGIISTVANFLRYAQGSEAHRVAAISWGKFQRFISIELSLHPNERMDAMSFLKMGRIELDRLIEQSPPIPTLVIDQFQVAFSHKKDIKRPEIAGGIEHTRIFEDRDSRLAKVAAEAAYVIQQKKGLMRQLVMEDIDKRIVSRAQDERSAMEAELRQEIMNTAQEMARNVARETALTTLKAAPVQHAARNLAQQIAANVREEVATIIPTGVVHKVAEKIKRRLSIIGAHPMTIAEAAAAVGAMRNSVTSVASTASTATPASPKSPVRIEIADAEEEDAIRSSTAYEKI
jgi:hypothetical protein